MVKWFTKILNGFTSHSDSIPRKSRYGIDNLEDDVIGYPPEQQGIPVVKDSVLFGRMAKEVQFLKRELGLTEAQFHEYLLPVLVNFSKFVHLLPASQSHHHCSGGGLIYHSFDTATSAMRHASMTQYPVSMGNISDAQQNNIEWKTATVIAGLLHDCGKAITDMVVSNGKEGDLELIWNPDGVDSITEWAYENKIERYFINWTKERKSKHKNASASIAAKLIPQATMEWISHGYDGKAIRTVMFEAIAGVNYNHIVCKIVAECDAESVKQDFYTRNSHITKEPRRTPISVMLTDLIRYFIMSGKWSINKKNAKVWFVDNELYLLWSMIVPELIEELEKAGYSIPESPDILARTMIEESAAITNGDDLYFSIYPEILRDPKNPKKLTVLKLLNLNKFILEPEKLYSIKQHKLKVTKPEKVVEPATVENIDTQAVVATEQRENKPEVVEHYLESAKNTLMRLIGVHKKELSITTANNNQTAEDYDDDYLDYLNEQNEMMAWESEYECENEEINNHISQSKEVVELPQFKTNMANHLFAEFGFEVTDDMRIIVPKKNESDVVESVCSICNCNKMQALLLIKESAEVILE